jgi:hypothetical protein
MPVEPIPFGPLLETSSEEIAGASPEAYNVISDARGTLRKRPGIGTYTVAPSTSIDANGVLGLWVTEPKVSHTSGSEVVDGTHPAVLYAVGATVNDADDDHPKGRNIYRIAGGSATLLTGTADEDRLVCDALATTRTPRPQFVETEALLVIAGGAEIAKVDIRPETFSAPNFTTNADYHDVSFLGGCPPLASFILGNSSRILANDTQLDQTKVRYSDISQGIVDFTGHESWDPSPGAAGFFTAEARPDSIVALSENTNIIFAFGSRSLQTFMPDTSVTFAPNVTQEVGCLAPYSVVKVDDHFFWIDHLTRIVRSNGQQAPEDVGAPIQETLDSLTTPSDCYGYRFSDRFADVIVFRFEADDVTLAYQMGVGWAQWASYNAATGEFGQLPVLSHLLRPDGGLNVVGLEDGTVRTLALSNTTDLGEAIVAHVTTGFLDRKSDHMKRSNKVRLTFKRTETLRTTVCYLDYRDSLASDWTTLAIDLGTEDGNLTPIVSFEALGTYYRRQWRFRFPDAGDLRLVKATEEFDVLEN